MGKFNKKTIIISILLIAVIVMTAVIFVMHKNDGDSGRRTEKGKLFLSKKEKEDQKKIEADIEAARKAEMEKQERIKKIESGEIELWSCFSDTVIMGDSRASGFDAYKFLLSNQVLAESGDTIKKISQNADAAKAQNPSKIITSYGVNDMKSGLWKDAEHYADDYEKEIKILKEKMPGVKVYVNSIIPVQTPALNNCGKWNEIPEYNKALKKMCKRNKIGFIDCGTNIEDKDYAGDYIHLNKNFYPEWAMEMATQSVS